MLTPEDTDRFRQQFEAQRDEVQQRIISLERALAAPDQYSEATQERGDDAVLLQSHDDTWDQLAFVRDELAQIQKALARIDAGTYGISEISGKPIPRARLEAEPTAATLVDETPPR